MPLIESTPPGAPTTAPPGAWEPLLELSRVAVRPLERFLRIHAASGILLFVTATVSLIIANTSLAEAWAHFWHTPLGLRAGAFTFERSLEWWVNDGLMTIFFFVVGMEIRREIHHGELSECRRASLPIAAALGGMIAPAGLYLLFAGGTETRPGWGVPMATDIAFAIGVLTVLGKRVPAALRVLLLALAIIDDLGAILVIALFYSSGISWAGLGIAALGFVGIFAMQRFGVRTKLFYLVPSVVAWAGIAAAGIHPTIAGVIVGLVTPVHAWLGQAGFLAGVRRELEVLAARAPGANAPEELAATLKHVDAARREALSPAESLIETLHPWVAFFIMPVFALANAGVTITSGGLDATSWQVVTAVTAGLVVGKPLGVLVLSWLVIRLNIATLPAGLNFRHLVVLAVVAGVGFTMSLFIAQLAFTDVRLLAAAKLGVLAASVVAAVLGLVLGRVLLSPGSAAGAAMTADEAERSTSH